MRAVGIAVVLGTVLACIMPMASAAATTSKLLEEADRLRSTNPQRFGVLLDTLEEESAKHSMEELQRHRLEYLRVYWKAVYGRKSALAIEEAQRLFAQTKDPDLKYRTGSLLANLHVLSRNFGEALRYLDLTLPMRGEVVNKDIRHDGINVASTLYGHLGQYTLSLRHAEETLADRPSPRAACHARALRLQALLSLEKLSAGGDDVFVDVIDECSRLDENIVSNFLRLALARKWAGEGQRERAIRLLQAYLPETEKIGYDRLIGEMHSLLAEQYLQMGGTAAAKYHADRAIVKNGPLANSLPLVMAYKVLYEIAQQRGDPVSALTNYRKYAEADKAYLNEVKARELVYQVARQENAQKSQQIQLLNQQNQVLQLQQHVDKQARNNTRLVIALLVMLVGLIGYWAYKVKRLHISLRRFAETDALTTISNRHFFTQRATRSLALCEKSGEEVALIMFDLDHFKVINDSYGHVTGDWALKQVAAACRGFCRDIDLLGRMGGEEFAILLHGCDLRGATRLAEDTRVRISQIDTRGSGFHFSITASFGVSSTLQSGYNLDALMAHADLMLYRAKNEGRNRVRVHATETPALPQPRLVAPHKVRSEVVAQPLPGGVAESEPARPDGPETTMATERMTG